MARSSSRLAAAAGTSGGKRTPGRPRREHSAGRSNGPLRSDCTTGLVGDPNAHVGRPGREARPKHRVSVALCRFTPSTRRSGSPAPLRDTHGAVRRPARGHDRDVERPQCQHDDLRQPSPWLIWPDRTGPTKLAGRRRQRENQPEPRSRPASCGPWGDNDDSSARGPWLQRFAGHVLEHRRGLVLVSSASCIKQSMMPAV